MGRGDVVVQSSEVAFEGGRLRLKGSEVVLQQTDIVDRAGEELATRYVVGGRGVELLEICGYLVNQRRRNLVGAVFRQKGLPDGVRVACSIMGNHLCRRIVKERLSAEVT